MFLYYLYKSVGEHNHNSLTCNVHIYIHIAVLSPAFSCLQKQVKSKANALKGHYPFAYYSLYILFTNTSAVCKWYLFSHCHLISFPQRVYLLNMWISLSWHVEHWVKSLLAISSISCQSASWSSSSFASDPASHECVWEGSEKWPKWLDSYQPNGRPSRGSWFLALNWLRVGCCSHLRSEPAEEDTSFCLSVPIPLPLSSK